MDEAWIGVVGGAVGAAGTLAGSVITTLLTQRGTRRDRHADYERQVRDRWFDERRSAYLEVLNTAHKAYWAMQFLDTPARDDREEQLEVLRDSVKVLYDLEPKVALVGSYDMRMAVIVFTNFVTVAGSTAEGIENDFEPGGTRKEAFERLLAAARMDLEVGGTELGRFGGGAHDA